MKSFISFLAVGSLCIGSAYAQDKIVYRDGNIINGKIIEVTPTEIKYHKPEHADGPLYSVKKAEVNSLVFENGTVELVNVSTSRRNRRVEREVLPYKNRITLGYFMPYVGGTSTGRVHTTTVLTYERHIAPFFSIKVPFEVNGASYNQSFMLGFMPKFYFNKSKIIQGFAGPEILLGVGKDRYFGYYSTSYTDSLGYMYYTDHYGETNRAAFINSLSANFGISSNPVDRFNITVDAALGANIFSYFETDETQMEESYYGKFLFKLGVHMGYNF